MNANVPGPLFNWLFTELRARRCRRRVRLAAASMRLLLILFGPFIWNVIWKVEIIEAL
jgi:hypothetical protein